MEINTLQDLNTIADQKIIELFARAEEEQKQREEARLRLIEQRKNELLYLIKEDLPSVVHDYIQISTRGEEDFIAASERGVHVVVQLPEAYPIHIYAYYDIFTEKWNIVYNYEIRRFDGYHIGKSDDFLTAVGGARSHYKFDLDTKAQQVVN